MKPKEKDSISIAGSYAAFLSMIEIGLGSLLHSLRVPLRGFCLSLNQGFVLSRAVKNHQSESFAKVLPVSISNMTALLKSLSPAGNRLGPMVAIAMQGVFFNSGVLLLGRNVIGISLGMALLCLWSYLQLTIYFYFIFGKKLLDSLEFHLERLQNYISIESSDLLWAVCILILTKVSLGILLGILAFTLPERYFLKYQDKLLKSYQAPKKVQRKSQKWKEAMKGSAKDLLHPLYLITFVLMFVFILATETSLQNMILFSIRPVAVGFLIFFLIRIFPSDKVLQSLKGTRFEGFASGVAKAAEKMKR